MGKLNVVYPHNQILFGKEKELSISTCYNMDKPWTHYEVRKVTYKKNACHLTYRKHPN